MVINDKSDISSVISRSFQPDTIIRCQESNDLNELAVQHPEKGCRPSQNVQTGLNCKKMPKLVARK